MNGPLDAAQPRTAVNYVYQLLMAVLCIYAITAMAISVALPLSKAARDVLDIADFVVCAVFLGDFVWTFANAPNKARYFFTWGWLDLLSSIPAIDLFRVGRLARLLRIIRLLRALRAIRSLTSILLQHRSQTTLMAALMVSFSLVVFCSLAVLSVEADGAGTIKTAADALWWAVSTISTVGYGDFYPVTEEGRIIAVILMTAGVGLFATFSGLIAAWLFQPKNADAQFEVQELRAAVLDLKRSIDALQSPGAGAPKAGASHEQ